MSIFRFPSKTLKYKLKLPLQVPRSVFGVNLRCTSLIEYKPQRQVMDHERTKIWPSKTHLAVFRSWGTKSQFTCHAPPCKFSSFSKRFLQLLLLRIYQREISNLRWCSFRGSGRSLDSVYLLRASPSSQCHTGTKVRLSYMAT